ncbi:AAA family ATPase [Vibrio parahaemolyticus]|nr:AAA family ATPase [Vibrio parahaemolyticus]
MIVTINNFGPVRSFTIDLDKDFHLLVGKNNIGKSYAITAVYLIIKAFNEIDDDRALYGFSPFYFSDNADIKDANVKAIIDSGSKLRQREEENITPHIKNMLITNFEKHFTLQLQNSFINTFNSLDSLRNRYNTENPTFSIQSTDTSLEFEVNENRINLVNMDMSTSYYIKKSKHNRSPLTKEDKTTLYFTEGKTKDFLQTLIVECLFKRNYHFINSFNSKVKTVHYLPASRSGLYQALSAFGQIIAELSKNRSFLSKKIELPGISEPVSDYFIRLSDIKVRKRSYEDKAINSIAQEIEDTILNGKVEFNSQTKQLMFHPNDTDLKLELSSTSSMVSELAPIVSYLRYVLTETQKQNTYYRPFALRKRPSSNDSEPSHLIMIEEPEAHLHPEIQLLLTEIFAKLVKANVKLIISSHSNFIFNKVNNLIMKGDFKVKQVSSGVFKSTKTGSVICPLEIDELGMEDDNFGDPTSTLFEEKMEIIDEINNSLENRNQ